MADGLEVSIDVEELAAPISEESPTGKPVRDDKDAMKLFQDAKDARMKASMLERKLAEFDPNAPDGGPAPEEPDWQAVLKHGSRLLREKSKDLWVVTWMIEALVRTDGLPGLIAGLDLTNRLCDQWFAQLYPVPDEDDLAEDILTSLTQFKGLDSSLKMPLLKLPITPEGRTAADLDLAASLETVGAEARQSRIDAGAVTLEMIRSEARKIPRTYFDAQIAQVESCIKALNAVGATLDTRVVEAFPDNGKDLIPKISGVREALEKVQSAISGLRAETQGGATEDDSAAATATSGSAVPAAGGASMAAGGPIRDRAGAFRELLRIADFFEQTEPHSPISSMIRRTVEWGKLSFSELLQQLIADGTARQGVYQLTGAPEPKSPNSD